MIEFDIPKEKSSIIKVFGVGGGGSNAVTHMYNLGIEGVNYVICNTDNQALEMSPVPNKIQLGSSLREGLGAGSKPEIGREATEEAIDQIEEILQTNTKMVFITAGMGGGTGTGGAPVVARLAKDMGILTVAIVTTPFMFEGKKRKTQAEEGIKELKGEVDALLVISNDKLREIHGNLKMSEAFGRADDILTVAAKGIAEIITKFGYVNVDFEDVNTVMRDSGVALMGIGEASGENRSVIAVEEAMSSPLLNDNNIVGAKSVLLNISYGTEELEMDEMAEITDYIQEAIGIESENLIFGLSEDESLEDQVRVTLIATGFESKKEREKRKKESTKVVHRLDSDKEPKVEVRDQKKAQNEQKEDKKKPYLKKEKEQSNQSKDHSASTRQFTFEFDDESPSSSHSSEEEEQPEDKLESELDYLLDEQEEAPVSNAEPVSDPFQLDDDQPSNNHSDENQEEEKTRAQQQRSPANDRRGQQPERQTQTTENESRELKQNFDERIQRLKSFNVRFKDQNGNKTVEDFEKEPAYKRKNIQIDTTPNSQDKSVSRYSLGESEDEDDYPLRKNSYLHDNVD